MSQIEPYVPQNKLRIVTATSLFDGHDATINVMRRIIQASGAEVIHLGHNRSVREIVDCAIQEDVNGIAVTSYQGGHVEFFKYMLDLLRDAGCGHIRIFGGGGGVILPEEIKELHAYGIARIYSPDDGRVMGLQGMVNDLLKTCDYSTLVDLNGQIDRIGDPDWRALSQLITVAENHPEGAKKSLELLRSRSGEKRVPVLGVTGTGGAGKSSLVDELVLRFLATNPDHRVAILSVDPTRRKTGGALLGDRIRMNAINSDRVYMRSLATRRSHLSLSESVDDVLSIMKAVDFDLVILESSGIGQSDSEIADHSDVSLYVMTPDYGAASQLEKIDMLDFADCVALNKFDKRGSKDALRDVKKQVRRNRGDFEAPDSAIPVFGTIASQFNDAGVNTLFKELLTRVSRKTGVDLGTDRFAEGEPSSPSSIVPPDRVRYLSEISESIRVNDRWVEKQARLAGTLEALRKSQEVLRAESGDVEDSVAQIGAVLDRLDGDLDPACRALLDGWSSFVESYGGEKFVYQVRGRNVSVETQSKSLAGTRISRVAVPRYTGHQDRLRWLLRENVPGRFPFTAGVFPFKRQGEDPTRMFAGEGGPERTNRRFHYLSHGMPAKRLSTAFDSVTLYGEDPDERPDIYGKIGNSGVSVCCLDDAKKLYSGFDLTDSMTSVSMTINGPAPVILGFFLNAAIDQQCELHIRESGHVAEARRKIEEILSTRSGSRPRYRDDLPDKHNGLGLMLLGVTGDQILDAETYARIRSETLRKVRGTVQADILKEDQAQNTCIFSTEFSLKLMGDVQEFFIQEGVQNFYSVSISGYHIAEAGANPITQLAFTLANGFTYVEYYLSRGFAIDDFAPNLSFFFSNGLDAEYAVVGRVARRIWARAMKFKYGVKDCSQKLKYHIQTSGRSLHAQEVDFNDIRTTLQALYAIYDNCNSLHTNAHDEAITTPTEDSVRRAMAIQLIINRELGLAKNENPLQGSFILDEMTDLVEDAVLAEFDRITDRGGVLGAMETMYQRGKIQEESLYYETLKHSGEYPIIGVNTFLSAKGSPTLIPDEVIRSTDEEKKAQITTVSSLRTRNEGDAKELLDRLQRAAIEDSNVFEELMTVTKTCSLGQITHALFEVGGRYRRSM